MKLYFFLFSLIILFGCGENLSDDATNKHVEEPKIGSKADREALFYYLYETTLETEAFSPIKEEILGVDVKALMRACKEDFVNAKTEADLFFAIKKLSCARKDRHLDVDTVDGGLLIPDIPAGIAPIKFRADFSTKDNHFLFVSDIAKNMEEYTSKENIPSLGDKLIEVNGKAFSEYVNQVEPYFRYSTVNNFYWNLAGRLGRRDITYLPPRFFQDKFNVTLERENGSHYDIRLPYIKPGELEFQGLSRTKYKGYKKIFETTCYHLYLPDDPQNKTVLLWWYGFRSSIDEDMQKLMDYAEDNNLLDHDVILDMTNSRGGSRGAVMLTQLQSRPYKTTFGNLRLSELGMEFAKERLEIPYRERFAVLDGDSKEGDNAKWVLDWLEQDVYPRHKAGEDYSSNVPFKCAHAPHTSEGILQPAERHFKGKMVCLVSPRGGSHFDQFTTIVSENGLGYMIGMPSGGYSNTWEAEKVITFPNSTQPLCRFMWSIGHTISPSGSIVEGNPAPVDEYVPLTQENSATYVDDLLDRALIFLDRGERE